MNSAAHLSYLDDLGHPTRVVNQLLAFHGHLVEGMFERGNVVQAGKIHIAAHA